MRFSADNNNGNFEIEFELTECESENPEVMIENFVSGMSLVMIKAINKTFDSREKARAFSMLTIKSLNGVMKTFIERSFDDERLKQEKDPYEYMVDFYEEWLEDTVTVTEDELLKAYADSEDLEIECTLENDNVQIFITNGERSDLLTEFGAEEVRKHPDHVELYCISALAVLIVFSDKIFPEYENPVRDRDNDPKKLVYAVNKLLEETPKDDSSVKCPRFTDFYDAWYFIATHPANSLDRIRRLPWHDESHFWHTFEFTVERVNPNHVTSYGSCVKESDEDKRHLNTKAEVWIEYGEVQENKDRKDGYEYCHDVGLDCGGNTFEEAVIKLANLMNESEYYQKMFRDDDDGSKAFRI